VTSPEPLVLKPDRDGLTRAAQLLRGGGIIAFPTDTVYGLGAAADDELAQRRIYAIKGRPVGLPLILMVAARSQLEGWVHVDSRAESVIERWWPGPLTVILHASGGGTLGVRVPNHEVTLELLRASGPLMTTSANLHGKDPAMTAEEAGSLPGLAGVLDGGRAPGGTASTVLDLTGPEMHVLREGAIPAAHVLGPPPPRAG
jgi:L-threonylcarbamoyladenylate synthase